jgi:hypothetical protein
MSGASDRRQPKIVGGPLSPEAKITQLLFGKDMATGGIDEQKTLYEASIYVWVDGERQPRNLIWIFAANSDIDAAMKVHKKLEVMRQERKVWADGPNWPAREVKLFDKYPPNCFSLFRIVRKLGLYHWTTLLLSKGEVTLFDIRS